MLLEKTKTRVMLGKRSRSILRLTSVMSMGFECPPADEFALSKQFAEKQSSPRSSLRQIIGFDLKVSSDNEADKTPPTDMQSGSPKSFRPTSGLEGLLSSPRPSGKGNKNLQPVDQLGFVAASDTAIGLPCEDNFFATERHSKSPGVAVRCMAHISESENIRHCSAFRNTCKQSNPIPIAQSSLPQPASPYQSKHLNSNQLSSKDPLQFVSQTPRMNAEVVYPDVDVKRCAFNLLTASPGTCEGADCISFFAMEFMEACFWCKRHLGQGRDIYMYRGDKAFCSVECRHQQIVTDERAERREKCSSITLKAGTAAQSRRRNPRTKALATGTVTAA